MAVTPEDEKALDDLLEGIHEELDAVHVGAAHRNPRRVSQQPGRSRVL